jgi:hypothetical protein
MKGKSFAPYAVLTFLIALVVIGCSNAPRNEIPAPGKQSSAISAVTPAAGGRDLPANRLALTTGERMPAQQLAVLNQQYQVALDQYVKQYKVAKNDQEREKLVYPTHLFAPKFVKFADENPTAPGAEDVVLWLVNNDYNTSGTHAIELIEQRYIRSNKLGPICPRLAWDQLEGPRQLLRKIIEQNPDKCTQGTACLSLARSLNGQKLVRGSVPEVDKLLHRAIANYSSYPYLKSGKTIGDEAKKDLFELHNLSVGCVAPEIEGVDANGRAMKLSDYRGKVALVDFFGDW